MDVLFRKTYQINTTSVHLLNAEILSQSRYVSVVRETYRILHLFLVFVSKSNMDIELY